MMVERRMQNGRRLESLGEALRSAEGALRALDDAEPSPEQIGSMFDPETAGDQAVEFELPSFSGVVRTLLEDGRRCILQKIGHVAATEDVPWPMGDIVRLKEKILHDSGFSDSAISAYVWTGRETPPDNIRRYVSAHRKELKCYTSLVLTGLRATYVEHVQWLRSKVDAQDVGRLRQWDEYLRRLEEPGDPTMWIVAEKWIALFFARHGQKAAKRAFDRVEGRLSPAAGSLVAQNVSR